MDKFCTTGQAEDDNTAHAHCMLYNSGCKHNSEYLILIAVPLKQSLHERFPMLPYTYIACLVNYCHPRPSSRTTLTPRDLTFIDSCVFCFRTLYEFRLKPAIQFEVCERLLGPSCIMPERNSRQATTTSYSNPYLHSSLAF